MGRRVLRRRIELRVLLAELGVVQAELLLLGKLVGEELCGGLRGLICRRVLARLQLLPLQPKLARRDLLPEGLAGPCQLVAKRVARQVLQQVGQVGRLPELLVLQLRGQAPGLQPERRFGLRQRLLLLLCGDRRGKV